MNQQTTNNPEIEKQLQNQINECRQVKDQLQAERDFISAVLNTVDTLIVVFDRNGRIIRFNPACEALTGYSFAEVKGKPFWDLFLLPIEKPLVRATFTKLITGQFPNKSKNHWVTKDGYRRLISWSSTTLLDANAKTEYVIGTGKDITKQEQAVLLLNTSESLQRVTTALLQHITTLNDVLAIICTEALELTGATGSAVLLLEDEMWLRVTSRNGFPLPALDRLPVGESFAGLVMGQGKPLLHNNPKNQMQAYHRNPDLKTLLAVPLCVDDTVLGVLDVVNKPEGFTKEDIQVMQLFADQAAIAIEHAQLHQQAQKLAVIEERQRLARELHDSVTQALYSVTLYADATRMAMSTGKQELAKEHLQELRNMAREAMMDMRLLIFELHPPVLEKEGLVTAVQTRLDTVEARSGLQTVLHIEGEEIRLPLSIEEELYRIVQEALNNTVKHAKARQVTVAFQYEDKRFCLKVQDDGIGFAPSIASQRGGMGLRGLKERAQRIGGQLFIESTLNKGTNLKIEIGL